jgi:uncharacterized surface protein with fasciclin (FAS1) repeats
MASQDWFVKYSTRAFGLHLYNLLAAHIVAPVFNTSDFPVNNLPNLAQGTVDVLSQPTSNTSFFVNSSNPDGASILVPNIPATNGIAHIVDAVIWPVFVSQNAFQAVLSLGPDFSTFVNLITAAGLEETIANLTDVTILALPNNAIPVETERYLLLPGNEEILVAVLQYHILLEVFNFASASIPTITLRMTTQGEQVLIGVVPRDTGDTLQVNFNEALVSTTFLSRDCLGYVIDKILVPQTLSSIVPRAVDGDPSSIELVAQSLNNSTRKRKTHKPNQGRTMQENSRYRVSDFKIILHPQARHEIPDHT